MLGGFTNIKPDISFLIFYNFFLRLPSFPGAQAPAKSGGGLGGETRVSGFLLSLEALVDPAPGQSPRETAQHQTDW